MPLYDSVRDKCLATALNSLKQLAIQSVEIALDLFFAQSPAKIEGHIAEGCYAQILGLKIELLMSAQRLSHGLGQANVFRDHLAVSSCSDLFKGKPNFQGTETA